MKKLSINNVRNIWQRLVIHPLLIAIFPVLFLYANNIDQTSASQALIPLLFSVPAVIMVWLLLYLWMRNTFKAGLAATLLAVLFFFYGHLYALLEHEAIFVPSHSILLPFLFLVWGYAAYFIKNTNSDLQSTTRVLNVIAVVLILLNIYNIITDQIEKPASLQAEIPSQPKVEDTYTPSRQIGNRPDIYFIILDVYANPTVMKDLYGYDDSKFLNDLKSNGFFIAPDSRMHNDETIRAISSILNMEYTPETEPPEVTYQRITNNRVVNFLKAKGYQYVYFGQLYEQGRFQIDADTYFNYYKSNEKPTFTMEYSTIFWNTTAFRPFYNYLFGQQYEGYYRDAILQTLAGLEKMPEIPGPKFVYAHILCPHAPFVFGPGGGRVVSTHYYDLIDKQYYLGQYIFISREIDKVIGTILKKSPSDPIIILQSDHGPRWTSQWEMILNAYHLPGDGNNLLYENISPVNSFRLILDHYLNANYEILQDK
jgi:hypothetical protein